MLFGPGEKDKETDTSTDGSRFEKQVDSLYDVEEEDEDDQDETDETDK